MAVETRFVVVRGGNEIMTFADKKAADDYDRMLDMADNLTALFETSQIDIEDKIKEDLSIYLAKNRDEVLYALMAKKRPAATKTPAAAKPTASKVEDIKVEDKSAASESAANDVQPAKPTRKRKTAANS